MTFNPLDLVLNYLSQLLSLLLKNYLVFVRNWKASLLHLLTPVIFIGIFGLITSLSPDSDVIPNPQVLNTFGPGDTIAKCLVRDVQNGRAERPDDPCVAVAYAPSTLPGVQDIMKRIAEKNDLTHGLLSEQTGNPNAAEMGGKFDILGLETELELELYLRRRDGYGHVRSAIVFNSEGLVNTFNTTVPTADPFYEAEYLGAKPLEGEIKSVLSFRIMANASEYERVSDPRLRNPFLDLQAQVSEAILTVHTNSESKLRYNIKDLPLVKSSSDNSLNTSILPRLGVLFYYTGSVGSFILTVRHIVHEKESKILDSLRSMGLNESCYWLSWLLYYATLMVITTGLSIGVGKWSGIPLFLGTDDSVLFQVFYTFNLSMVTMAMVLASILPSTFAANIVSTLIFSVGLVVIMFFTMAAPYFDIQSLANPYQYGDLVSQLGFIPHFSFLQLVTNMASMTRQIENSNQTAYYTSDDLSNGAYQYARLHFVPQTEYFDALEVVNEEFCAERAKSDNGFGDAYQCLSYSSYIDYYGSFGPIPTTPARVEQIKKQKCSEKWKLANGVNKETCESSSGTFVPLAQNTTVVFWGSYDESFELYELGIFERSYDFETQTTIIKQLKPIPSEYQHMVDVFDSLDGICTCPYSLSPDADTLNKQYWSCVLFVLLAWYLGQVITFGHGRPENPLFIFFPWYWLPGLVTKPGFLSRLTSTPSTARSNETDNDVLEETERVKASLASGKQDPVVINNIVKDFGIIRKFRAVDGVAVGIPHGQVFALLGHNGAGKTTLINMMLGLISVSGGDCTVQGRSVVDNIGSVRSMVSTCPQHDILWNYLTASEHMWFYGLFQGMSFEAIREQTKYILGKVKLTAVSRAFAGSYSGGMKRRLSVAISVLGDKKIVFLDEPTTGMDPQNRRHVWDLINELKKDRVVILTTHAMEEADTLGDRIGIMKHGHLVALGTSLHLKNKFGGKYQVDAIPSHDSNRSDFVKDLKRTFPAASVTSISSTGPITVEFSKENHSEVPVLFRYMEDKAKSGVVKNWGFSHSSLEDVFIQLTQDEQIEVAMPVLEIPDRELPPVPLDGIKKDDVVIDAMEVDDHALIPDASRDSLSSGAISKPSPSTAKQIRAMVLKSFSLQKSQTGTQVCQFITVAILVGLLGVRNLLFFGSFDPNFSGGSSQEESSVAVCVSCMAQVAQIYQACLGETVANGFGGIRQCASSQGYSTGEEYFNDQQDLHQWDIYGKYLFNDDYTLDTIEERFPGIFDATFNRYRTECGEQCQGRGTSRERSPFDLSRDTSPLLNNDIWLTGRFNDVVWGPEYKPYEPFGRAQDRILVAVNPRSSSSLTSAQLSTRVGNICPNPVDRPFRTPVLTTTMDPEPLITLRCYSPYSPVYLERLFPGISGKPDTLCNQVYYTPDGLANVTAAKNALDELITNGGGLLSRYPTKISMERSANGTKFDAAPLLCPSEYYQNFKPEEDTDVERALNNWLFDTQNQLEAKTGVFEKHFVDDENVWERRFTPEEYAIVDDNLPHTSVIFHDVQVESGKPVELDVTVQTIIEGERTYRRRPGLGLSNNQKLFPFSDPTARLGSILAGLTTATLREAQSQGLSDAGSPLNTNDPELEVHVGYSYLPINEEVDKLSANENYLQGTLTIVCGVASLLITLSVTLIFPVLVFHIVYEKEHKLRAMMLMMGLQPGVYWVVQYIFDIIVVGSITGVVIIVGLATGCMNGSLILVLLVWGNTMVAMSFLASVFFQRTMSANILLYFLTIGSVAAAFVLSSVVYTVQLEGAYFSIPVDPPHELFWFPPFALFHGVYKSVLEALGGDGSGLTDATFTASVLYLVMEFFVMMLLALYLDVVLPKEFGIRRHPLFFIEDLVSLFGVKWSMCSKGDSYSTLEEDVMDELDDDVLEEYKQVSQGEALDVNKVAIEIKGLRKVYHGRGGIKVAVKNLFLRINSGECFGLLGPNGAGKTTVISVLTGLFGMSSGQAKLNGYDISTEMRYVYQALGICPQFDVTWPALTVMEHLLFYARLKGADKSSEREVALRAARAVQLEDALKKKSKELSGGMRRRLSLAMSLIGDPSVVFLDEPTTGVDPETRRQVWQLIEREKAKRCIVLTTHSMEEADALCDRIGIMAHGELKALGRNQHLKAKFSSGFKLSVTITNGLEEKADMFIRSIASSARPVEQFSHTAVYQIDIEENSMSSVFEGMQRDSKANGIQDWGMRQASLEEVFVEIAQEAEAEYGYA